MCIHISGKKYVQMHGCQLTKILFNQLFHEINGKYSMNKGAPEDAIHRSGQADPGPPHALSSPAA
jgi:hypothetical protein